MNDKPKCYWCDKPAEVKDYREIDGITSKILSCMECAHISTASLIKKQKRKSKKTWTVWVGGGEVNDHYLSKAEAEVLRDKYIADGYDDVVMEDHS